MSMQNAIDFLGLLDDDDFRRSMYSIKGVDDFNVFLEKNDLYFSHGEFEDAYNKLVFQAQFESQHDSLKNKASFLALITA